MNQSFGVWSERHCKKLIRALCFGQERREKIHQKIGPVCEEDRQGYVRETKINA